MTTHYVVIGMNYGDEGKGLVTDALVRRNRIEQVVRYCGGAQAGHTVVEQSNSTTTRRHVFHTFGSGTFAGARTLLLNHFVFNPYLLLEEATDLQSKVDFTLPRIRRSIGTPETIVYDIAINQWAEYCRGGARHGSCGVGVNETLQREAAGYTVREFDSSRKSFTQIWNEWVPIRLKRLGIEWPSPEQLDSLPSSLSWLRSFLIDHSPEKQEEARNEICNRAYKFADPVLLTRSQIRTPSVFEGSQGMMLDKTYGTFPHVTNASVGLDNVLSILSVLDEWTNVQPVFVTRPYATRHGAGPLPFEGSDPSILEELGSNATIDSTNVDNPWQRKLRFAPLWVNRDEPESPANVAYRHLRDMQEAIHKWQLRVHVLSPMLFITCMDQMKNRIAVQTSRDASVHHSIHNASFPEWLADKLHMRLLGTSWGPTSSDVEWEA